VSCNRVRRTVFLWVDRDRENRVQGAVDEHVGSCPHCRDRAMRVERFVVLLRTRCGRSSAPVSLQERIRDLLGNLGNE
jgi:hypothetical protein